MSVPVRAEKIISDLTFATVGETKLQLDLHLPEATKPAGLIIWVHGGAWREGSKKDVDLKGLVARGWAIASVDYRLSTVARFPAQIHDIKAAIRYLRAHATDYNLPPARTLSLPGLPPADTFAALGWSHKRFPRPWKARGR